MSALEKYSSYKDSGVAWIREIPENWKVIPLKACTEVKSIKNTSNLELLSVYLDLGVIRFKDIKQKRTNATSTDLSDYQIVDPGDLVLNNQQAWRGSVGVSTYRGIVSPAYIVLKLSEIFNSNFANFYFRNGLTVSQYLINSKGVGTIQRNLYWVHLKQTYVCAPPIEEQIKIANFLDTKIAQIDEAIKQKEELISLLKERRQVIVHKAVTLGLDDSVTMKDSGVEWIGEIPEHWETKRFRYLFSFSKGLNITKENLQEEGIPCVNYGEIHSKYGFEVSPDKNSLKCVKEDYLKNSQKSILKHGDFVFADTSEDIEGSGNFTYLNSDKITFAGYHTVIARVKQKINPRFFAYLFDSDNFRNQVRRRVKGVKVYSITNGILKEILLWIPPMRDQDEIVEELDKRTEKIDKIISFQEDEIFKLKEYKNTLIDSCVTGKVRVI
ncbi:MAG: restriction endonuclease subunit S [Campylobacterota bacterium]|nr:restriction endonuclease subunit S [Campylobacterota bacterium]